MESKPLRGGCQHMLWLHWLSRAGSSQCRQQTSYGRPGQLCQLAALCSDRGQPGADVKWTKNCVRQGAMGLAGVEYLARLGPSCSGSLPVDATYCKENEAIVTRHQSCTYLLMTDGMVGKDQWKSEG